MHSLDEDSIRRTACLNTSFPPILIAWSLALTVSLEAGFRDPPAGMSRISDWQPSDPRTTLPRASPFRSLETTQAAAPSPKRTQVERSS